MIFWVPLVLLGLVESVRLGRIQLRAGQAADRRCALHLGRPGVGRGDGLSPHGLGPLSAADPERQRPAGSSGGVGDLELACRWTTSVPGTGA